MTYRNDHCVPVIPSQVLGFW